MKDEFEDFQAQMKRLTEQNRVARKILGVSASDDKVAIKKAFRHLAAKYHPRSAKLCYLFLSVVLLLSAL